MVQLPRALALMAGVSVLAISTSSFAQTPPPGGATGDPLEEVVVTGSRIARTTFETPTPVTSVSEKQLEAKAAPTLVELLRDVPALRPNRNNNFATDVGGSTFNMRSLGPTRTLVLIDGQRVMNSSPTGSFDLNLLPAPLISRLEIVTAGASSVYGSDAVTGVVNVFLSNNLDGGKADIQGTMSTHGDVETYSASLAYGTKFLDGRGRFVIGASYYDRPKILYQKSRDWGDDGYTLIPNAAYTPTNGQFRQIFATDVRLSQMTFGGVITSNGPLKNIQFGAGGAQSRLVQGTNVGTIWMQGGEGLQTQPDLGVLVPTSERETLFARVSYDVTPDVEARFDLLAARTVQRHTNNFNYNNADITIRNDNAFLPANIRATMAANNLSTITIGRLNPELGINDNTTEIQYVRASAGLKGSFANDWAWDLGVTNTYSQYDNESRNNRNNINWTLALDSVIGPGGQAVCRSTLSNPSNGCVAANPFGLNSLSPAAVAYVAGTSWIKAYSRATSLNANVRGELGATWAGPIGVAAGAEYREETVNFKSDPISQLNGWRQASSAAYSGKVDVKEAYAEASVPLAKDMALAQSLELDLAARFVDYSTSGSTAVWKVGLNWSLNDQVRFRGTYSRDFRAPTINELFAAATVRQGIGVIDRTNNTNVVIRTRSGGNANLDPEVAHTLTFGIVARPAFIRGLQVSVDAFDIELKDAISTLAAQEVIDRCQGGNAVFCNSITRDPTSRAITLVETTSFNAQALKTRGLDFEASYQFPLDTIAPSMDGTIGVSTVATYVDRLITVSNGIALDTAGQLTGTTPSPKWRAATTVSYQSGPATVRLLANYVGGGKYDVTYGPLDISQNKFKGIVYFDISGQYDVTERLQLYAKVENLFDTDPRLLADGTIVRAGAANASAFFDVIGRVVGVGARYKW